jgi:predicted nuclease with TOPRIM domain
MRERLERRLAALTAEYEVGQHKLAELETKQAALRDTLLRIYGAMTVLREELEADLLSGASQEQEDSGATSASQ